MSFILGTTTLKVFIQTFLLTFGNLETGEKPVQLKGDVYYNPSLGH